MLNNVFNRIEPLALLNSDFSYKYSTMLYFIRFIVCLSCACNVIIRRGVDPGGQGGSRLPMKIFGGGGGGANISFCPPPPNNFDNLKN